MKRSQSPKNYRKIKRKKSILKSSTFWISLIFILVSSGLFYFVCFSSFVQIKNIRVEKENIEVSPGIDLISDQTIQSVSELIDDEVNKKIIFYDSKSILLVNGNSIVRKIIEQFPEISQVDVEKKLTQGNINFYLSRKRGVAKWCQDNNCLLIDKSGEIFSQLSDIDQELLRITRIDDQSELIIRKSVINEEELSNILDIYTKIKQSSELDFYIKEIKIESDEKVNVITEDGWIAYINPKGDISWQLTKLEASLKEVPSENRDELEYIELRFNNFAPYKYKSD
jgi:cell division septal protein FtsQ